MGKLIITHMEIRKKRALVTALTGNQGLESLELAGWEESQFLGSIHAGKVQKVLPDLKGAFVEIEDRIPCYYPMEKGMVPVFRKEKKTDQLKPGDELLVQVTREAMKTKAPSVSANLSFTGEYLVLTTVNKTIGISSRISGEKRQKLREMIQSLLPEDRKYGVIVRTSAADVAQEILKKELEELVQELEMVLEKGMHCPCFTRIKNGDSRILETVKNCRWEELESIVTDDPDIFRQISRYAEKTSLSQREKIRLYQDPLLPLYKLFSLETGLQRALSEKVWMKSGGFLVIQQTEACTVIDVNSGKNSAGKMKETLIGQLNREAAAECARQIRLRNLSGIILIDFINMESKEEEEELLGYMRSLVRLDGITTRAVDITPLGLMEITRKKQKKTLREQWEQLQEGV